MVAIALRSSHNGFVVLEVDVGDSSLVRRLYAGKRHTSVSCPGVNLVWIRGTKRVARFVLKPR